MEKALAELERALQLNPGLIPAYLNQALILEEQGEEAEAIEIYSAALNRPEIERNPEEAYLAHLKRGDLYLRESEPALAIADYCAALTRDNAEGFRNLGLAYRRLGQEEAALTCFRWAVQYRSDDFAAQRRLGDAAHALARQGDQQDALRQTAITAYTRAVQLIERESSRLSDRMELRLALGRLYRREQRMEDARRTLKEAATIAEHLEKDLIYTTAIYELGLLYRDRYRLQPGEEWLANARQNLSTAATLFETMRDKVSAARAYLALARLCREAGKKEDARRHLDQAQAQLDRGFDLPDSASLELNQAIKEEEARLLSAGEDGNAPPPSAPLDPENASQLEA